MGVECAEAYAAGGEQVGEFPQQLGDDPGQHKNNDGDKHPRNCRTDRLQHLPAQILHGLGELFADRTGMRELFECKDQKQEDPEQTQQPGDE